MQTSDRRQVAVVLALLGAVAVATAASGCGGNPNSPVTPQIAVPAGSKAGSVSGNHAMPHVCIITAAQLNAGAAVVLDMSNGLHSHAAALTAEQVKQIAAGVRVTVTSSTDTHSNGSDPHNHDVTFN